MLQHNAVQEYLLQSLSGMVYNMVNDPNKTHDEISISMIDENYDVLGELCKSWIYKGMYPVVSNEDNLKRFKLTSGTVKEIIDKSIVYRNYRDNMVKFAVRDDSEFKYEILFELDSPAEGFLKNELELKGIPVCNGFVDYDIDTDSCEVCVKLMNSTYFIRTKK